MITKDKEEQLLLCTPARPCKLTLVISCRKNCTQEVTCSSDPAKEMLLSLDRGMGSLKILMLAFVSYKGQTCEVDNQQRNGYVTDLPQVFDLVSTSANDGPHERLGDEDLDFQHGSWIPSFDVLNCHREGGERTDWKLVIWYDEGRGNKYSMTNSHLLLSSSIL